MRFGELFVDLQRPQSRRFRLRHAVGRGRDIVARKENVSFRQTRIGECVIRVFLDRLPIKFSRLFQRFAGPIIPMEFSFQVKLIGFRVCCVVFRLSAPRRPTISISVCPKHRGRSRFAEKLVRLIAVILLAPDHILGRDVDQFQTERQLSPRCTTRPVKIAWTFNSLPIVFASVSLPL